MPMLRLLSFAMILALPACAVLTGDEDERPVTDPSVPVVTAFAETTPVPSLDDAADDPAIWVHPTDPAKSVILGTDKRSGLYIYDLSGAQIGALPLPRPNNVDLRQNLAGSGIDIAVTSNRGDNTVSLIAVAGGEATEVGRVPTVREEPYGICLGDVGGGVVAVTHKGGEVDLYQVAAVDGGLTARAFNSFSLGSQLEGCVFDEPNGTLFVGIEEVGIVALPTSKLAALTAADAATVDSVDGATGTTADIEGLTLYRTGEKDGYLIASSQGNNTFAAYDRRTRAFAGRFSIGPSPSGIDGAEETDGIAATAAALGEAYPQGLLVVQDGFNDEGDGVAPQNFKLVPAERFVPLLAPAN